ncbi:MAG TPA: acyltransferase [Burkholderiaceae bacterium]|jgi:acetyltransferase-like isoleucine patch superfamily enzyme
MHVEPINRYADLKLAGPPVKRLIKLIYLQLFRRPCRASLGKGTYALQPFHCNAPERLKIGARGTIGTRATFNIITEWFSQTFSPRIEIGDDVYVGSNCELVAIEGIVIGNGCTLSDEVYINDASHSIDPRKGLFMDRPLESKGGIRIGDGCFIGRRAIILPGVHLGDFCVIGAGAVVTKSAPNFSLITGNPARITATFNQELGAWTRCGALDIGA